MEHAHSQQLHLCPGWMVIYSCTPRVSSAKKKKGKKEIERGGGEERDRREKKRIRKGEKEKRKENHGVPGLPNRGKIKKERGGFLIPSLLFPFLHFESGPSFQFKFLSYMLGN